jgi:SAM-dependent methyltransferase
MSSGSLLVERGGTSRLDSGVARAPDRRTAAARSAPGVLERAPDGRLDALFQALKHLSGEQQTGPVSGGHDSAHNEESGVVVRSPVYMLGHGIGSNRAETEVARRRPSAPRMSDIDAARESIELAVKPPPPVRVGILRRIARRALLRFGQAHARHQQQIDRQLVALISSLEARLGSAEAHVAGLDRAAEELRARNHMIGEEAGALAALAQALASQVAEQAHRLAPLERLAAQIQAVPEPARVGLERFEVAQAGTVIGYRHARPPVSAEDDYVAFEDVFRSSEDVIRDRQRPYLPLLDQRQPVLDAGCGRGEFLELLRGAGVPARGVDLDPGMVARARAKGLDVEQGDLVAHLERVADGSLGVVFAAQVVEHLPYRELLAFLRLAYQKLQPGGLLIAETVNPHHAGTLKSFWTDPTHQHPIFPEVLLNLVRGIGFSSAYVFHPGGTGDVDADRHQRGDYAVVAERGEAASTDTAG